MTTPQPFSWILKPGQLTAPSGPLAALLRHEYAPQLSEALRGGFELIYGAAGRETKRRWFLAECRRDDRAAMDRIHELLVLAVLSLERWLFIDVEPDLAGETHPEFLMAVPPDLRQMLVEVKTVHRAEALAPCDEARGAFESYLKDRLARCGYECTSITLHALPGQVPSTDQYETMVELVLGRLRRSLLKARGYFGVELPTGAKLDLLLADAGFQGPLAGRRREIEAIKANVGRMFHDTFRFFDEQEALKASYGERIPARIGRAAAQIERSETNLPAVVAIATSDPRWTVRDAVHAAREKLKERQASRLVPVALLVVSFFQPKPEPIPDSPDWVKAAELARWRQTLVLGAHAVWVPLNDAAPTVSKLYTFDPTAPRAVVTVPSMPTPPPVPLGAAKRRPTTRRHKRR